MRTAAWPRRPEGTRPGWWRAGLALHALAFLGLGVSVALGPARPVLAPVWGSAGALLHHAADARAAADLGPAPDFTLATFDGGTFRLADRRGQVVVVNFWASWCVPCRQEAPRFAAADAAYRDRGVVFVGVDIQDTDRDARAFLAEFGLRYPNGPDRDGSVAAAYGIGGVPTTFVIDRAGRIRRRWTGEIQADQLTGFIAEALR